MAIRSLDCLVGDVDVVDVDGKEVRLCEFLILEYVNLGGVDDDDRDVVVDLVDSDDVVGGVGDKNFSSSLSNSPFLKLLLPPPPLLLPLLPRILFRKPPSFLVEEEEDEEGAKRSSML